MNRYKPPKPRLALAASAVALSALTLLALVVLPAKLDTGAPELAQARDESAGTTRVVATVSRLLTDLHPVERK